MKSAEIVNLESVRINSVVTQIHDELKKLGIDTPEEIEEIYDEFISAVPKEDMEAFNSAFDIAFPSVREKFTQK